MSRQGLWDELSGLKACVSTQKQQLHEAKREREADAVSRSKLVSEVSSLKEAHGDKCRELEV